MIVLALTFSALAADVAAYPLSAEVSLPPMGIARVEVPLDLRSADDPADGSDLLLLDGNGAAVPFVRLQTTSEAEPVRPGPDLVVAATFDPGEYRVEVRNRPIDALIVRPPDVPGATSVTVLAQRDREWVPVSEPTLVWRIQAGEKLEVPLTEAVIGDLRVLLDWNTPEPALAIEIEGLRHAGPRIPEHVVSVPVASWRLQENGYARYEIPLPSAWPASRIELRPTEDLFDRVAGAVQPVVTAPGEPMWWEPTPGGWESIQRLHLGGADIERTTVLAPTPSTDHLTVLVEGIDRPPLDVPEVGVIVPGVHLVVQDAGPGPHTLYGGAPVGTSPSYDLEAAERELARIPATAIAPGPAARNPAYVAPEVRGGLVGPGRELSLARYRWSHDVVGPTGLVRIPLPAEVLSTARSDLGDLRLVAADGRQIPYVLRRRGADIDLGTLTFTRTERGAQSILEVPLPVKGVPLATVEITTSAPVFQRRVTLSRPVAARLETVRAYEWVGEDRPGRLVLAVGEQVFGETLAVTIDNGDDPPLPIDGIAASSPAWELWAALPAPGARLVYGDASATRPDYDLGLLGDAIGRRVAEVATLGARQALVRPPPSLADRLLTGFGLAVLGIGLLVLTIRLLRAAPAAPAAPEAAPDGG